MNAVLTQTRGALRAKLGRCSRCMRVSFASAITGWALALLAARVMSWPEAGIALGIGACALTGLWTTHLLVFAWRAIGPPAGTADTTTGGGERTEQWERTARSRRHMMLAFAKAVAFVAVATAVPATLLAQSQPCDGCARYSGSVCFSCCTCQYNNCTSGCASGDARCVNGCLRTYNGCTDTCR